MPSNHQETARPLVESFTASTIEPRDEPGSASATGAHLTDSDDRLTWGSPVDTFRTLIMAMILAFIFRAFLVEPFIVPTGSMAHTLLGAHLRVVCENCGFDYAAGPRGGSRYDAPFELPGETICPSCQHRMPKPDLSGLIPRDGDRILVQRWPYELGGPFAPRRWDVLVFRDPADPEQNYIKRLVALPGETIEIIDGDVFINGAVARKSDAAQSSLWYPVYHHDFAPLEDSELGVRARWVAVDRELLPLPVGTTGGWTDAESRLIRHEPINAAPRTLLFAPRGAHQYDQDLYAYDHGSSGARYGDVRLCAALMLEDTDGALSFEIHRRDRAIVARIEPRVGVSLKLLARPGFHSRAPGDSTHAEFRIAPGPHSIEFAYVDWRAYLRLDGRDVLELPVNPGEAELEAVREWRLPPATECRITAAGLKFALERLRIDRDVHYTYDADDTRRAYPGDVFELREDEFFVLGDNSPQSHDSREWLVRGPHLPPEYRLGTVRRDQIVGRAVFVYLPGLQPPDWGWWKIPDIGRMRFIR